MAALWCVIDFLQTYNGAVTAAATVAIGAFTLVLVFVSNRQAKLTKEAIIIDKRAFVFAVAFHQAYEPNPITKLYDWRFRPILRNAGETSTKNLRMYVSCEVRNSILPPGYSFGYQAKDVAGGTIAPKLDVRGGLAPPFPQSAVTAQDLVDSQAGRKFIYLWGWIEYFDRFSRTKKHVTRYCWLIGAVGDPLKFVPNTNAMPPTPGALAFENLHHNEGNCIDDECK
jgi:hypothetical protein